MGNREIAGWARPDPVLPLHLVAHLQERFETRPSPRLGDVLTAAAHRLLRLQRGPQPAHVLDIDAGVPDLEESHRRIVSHLGAVTVHGQTRRGAGVPVRSSQLMPESRIQANRTAASHTTRDRLACANSVVAPSPPSALPKVSMWS